MSQDHLLGVEKGPIQLTVPTQPKRERVALAGLAVGVSLAALGLMWGFLGGANPQTGLFLALAVGLSVVGSIWFHDRIQKKRLQKWEPFLAHHVGELPPLTSFPSLGDAADSLCLWFRETLEDRGRDERESFVSTIVTLANALEARDITTRNHSAKVANFSVRLGRHMGLDTEELYEIHLGGLLHDIGKIGIRDDILLKPSGLNKDEYEIMKTHPQVGYEILSGVSGMKRVAEIVRHHHEMWDGSGYPEGLAGEAIPLGARLVAVADTYMALTENRPYRDGRSLERALQELRRVAGRQLDPRAIDHLEQMVHEDRAELGRREAQKVA